MQLSKVFNKIHVILFQKPSIKSLRKLGLKCGKNFNIQNGVSIDVSHCNLISIGNDVTLAPDSMILAHDASTKRMKNGGFTKTAEVHIGNRVFIGAKAIVMPGVTIMDDSIVGAGSIVTRDVLQGTVVAGNPARVIMSTEEYIKKTQNGTKYMKIE